jgi:Flp pilus assembly protein TadG
MAAIILPAVLGTAGFGFDVGYWYLTKRNFQGAADAAAISAAIAYASGNVAGYVTEAKAAAAQHGATHGQNGIDVAVTFPYADGTAACPAGNNDCLLVNITQAQSPMLARLVGQGNLTVGSQSVAQISHQTYCMLATNSSNSNVNNVTGIDLTLFFIGILNMPNCSIASNWKGADSLRLDGFLFVGLTAYTATLMGQFDNQCGFCFPGPHWTHPIKQNAVAPFAPIVDPYAARSW